MKLTILLASLSLVGSLLAQSSVSIDGRQSTVTTYFLQFQDELKLTPHDEFVVKKSITNPSGWIRHRMQQLHKGYEVIGSQVTLHEKNGILQKRSGPLAHSIGNLENHRLSLQEQERLITAAENRQMQVTASRQVIINLGYPQLNQDYIIAYEAIGEDNTPMPPIKKRYYINPVYKTIIDVHDLIKHESVESNVPTKYYGNQDVIIDKFEGENNSEKYRLRDETRGQGIYTLNAQVADGLNGQQYGDFVADSPDFDLPNEWEYEVATDAHYCASRYYDFMLDRFGYDGLDGEGHELYCINNIGGKFFVNAFWNGSYSFYGNGDCANYDPLTTLDVVSHEFTHGFTDFTSDLIYRNESGALNESISDIFGKALEFEFDFTNFDWYIGNKFRISDDANPFRSMRDPNERFDPKYYGGNYWYTGAGDNGGVHSNSGLLNYWFYVLSEGFSGINEVDEAYTISPIGMEEALNIVFGMQTGYLTQNSTYLDAMYASLEVAEDLYGENSDSYNVVLETWKLCGLFPGFEEYDLDIQIRENQQIYFCPGDAIVLTLQINNVGSLDYPESSVLLNSDSELLQSLLLDPIQLPQPFEPGDSMLLEFVINDLDISSFEQYEVVMQNIDNNTLNNTTDGYLYLAENTLIDVSLESFTLNYAFDCSRDSVRSYTYQMRNNGCKAIPADQEFILRVDAGIHGIKEFSVFNFSDFNPLSTRSSTRFFSQELDVIYDFESAELIFEQDEDISNNTIVSTSSELQYIEDDYWEGFDQTANDFAFSIEGNSYATEFDIATYQGNEVLAIRGLASATAYINCPDIDDFFESNYQKRELRFCFDLSIDEPIFSFESLKLLPSTSQNTDFNYDVFIKVEYDTTSYYITDLPQGSFSKFEIDLPSQYQGQLELTAFVISGSNLSPIEQFQDDSHYLLFDNFRIQDRQIKEGLTTDHGFILYPSPVNSRLQIEDLETTQLYDIEIVNNLGQILVEKLDAKGYISLDIDQLIDGIYYARILREDKVLTSLKFLKSNF